MTVYLDEVFLENLLIDYLLLVTCSQIVAAPLQRKRCLIAAALGGLYAMTAYFPYFRFLYILPAKLIVGMLLGVIVFRRRWKATALFLLISAALAGVLRYLPPTYHITWPILGLCALGFYIMLTVLFYHGITTQKQLIHASVRLDAVTWQLTVLQDTGNMLVDHSGRPILIVNRYALGDYDPYIDPEQEPCTQLHQQFPRHNVLFVPYCTLSGGGVLPAIQCDYLQIAGKELEKVYIAICDEHFAGEYQGLWCGERSG